MGDGGGAASYRWWSREERGQELPADCVKAVGRGFQVHGAASAKALLEKSVCLRWEEHHRVSSQAHSGLWERR